MRTSGLVIILQDEENSRKQGANLVNPHNTAISLVSYRFRDKLRRGAGSREQQEQG